SLPYWGFLFYLSVIVLSFIKKLENFLLFILIVGAIFSIYLTIVELFIIKAVCIWCLISAFCSWIMSISAVLGNVKK
ncbi:MAG: vitamin K epoxide reductase family protein, partial [candidate division WOR-3 bacterium]